MKKVFDNLVFGFALYMTFLPWAFMPWYLAMPTSILFAMLTVAAFWLSVLRIMNEK